VAPRIYECSHSLKAEARAAKQKSKTIDKILIIVIIIFKILLCDKLILSIKFKNGLTI